MVCPIELVLYGWASFIIIVIRIRRERKHKLTHKLVQSRMRYQLNHSSSLLQRLSETYDQLPPLHDGQRKAHNIIQDGARSGN